MDQNLSISPAKKDQAAVITRLINGAYRGEAAELGWTSESEYMDGERVTETDTERLLSQADRANFTCCTAEGEIVGFVSFEKRQSSIHLSLLTVSPKAQDAGIGRRLLEFADRYARSVCKATILITVVNIRIELIAWYERRGYRQTGIATPFPEGAGKPKIPVYLVEMEKEIV